eukprot:TRINITY_DN297_c0_g1_i4.p1 TRINITY_DN297_c0_g1~~TRINITY_DN297_c0_g1_i4.p1  ORF type:complete len:198 (+),score=31.43 TRINITY_DN297_c0_g1_i4:126-719(+)
MSEQENTDVFRVYKPLVRKHIRKFTHKTRSFRKHSACSDHTLPDTLTKSVPNQEIPPPFLPSTVPIELNEEPVLISPLKALLSKSPEETSEQNLPELPSCTFLPLKNTKARKLERFKLFKEEEFPLFSQRMTQVPLNEPGYDNDDDTDNEQIKSGTKVMEDSIREGLRKYRKEVVNEGKFEHCTATLCVIIYALTLT